MHVPCACVYLHAFERSCTRWIILAPGEADSSLHEVFVNLTLRCQEHVEFAYYCMLVLKMAEVCCSRAGAEAMRDPKLLQKWKVVLPMCDMCCPCKSAYASAKEEKTASSIAQFECVSLLVRLTCQRSYPTSHSCSLKNSSDPGITFRSLTVVRSRNISFFSVWSLDHMQRAI